MEFLPRELGVLDFINADAIAAGLSPLDPGRVEIQAGRTMVQSIRDHVRRGRDFAFETTLSGRRYARWIPRWQASGYRVGWFFLALSTPEIAIARVRSRVLRGGHDVAETTIRRRFESDRRNFDHLYKPLVDHWRILDNSGASPIPIEEGVNT